MDREKENALRMLEGCICRLSVTDEKDEAYRMYYWIGQWSAKILNHTIGRIEEQEKQEGGVSDVRRTKRKRR